MKKNHLLLRFVVLVTAMMCTLGAAAAEAYANYTPSNTTLTFYYDNLRSSRTGTTYDMNTGNDSPGWYTDGINANVTKVVFNSSFADARPTTTFSWFSGMQNLQSITGMNEYLNTSEVTKMGNMFLDCGNLTILDLSGFNTSKVTSMNWMFGRCNNLRTIYVGNGWSTASVAYSNYMFNSCTSLVGGQGTTYDSSHTNATYAHIDGGPSNPGYFTEKGPEAYACYTPSNTTLTFYYDGQRSSRTGTTYNLNTGDNKPGWRNDGTYTNVTKVVFDPSFANARPTTTYGWFYSMYRLQSIVGMHNYLNTSEVTNMDYMFYYCDNDNLTSLDLSHFNTSKVTKMGWMFYSCSNLRTIYVGSGWSTAAVTSSNSMLWGCTSLVGGQGTTYNESNPWDKTYAHIDGGPSNPGYFTDKNAPVAYACYTSSNTTLTFYYDSQRSSRTGTTYDLNEGDNITGWESDGTNASVTKVVFDPSFAGARPTTTSGWFYDMRNLESITGMSYLNTCEVTNMSWMFYNCSKLTSLDVSQFNTSKVTDMSYMFDNCRTLTSLDLSHFNTSKVTNMCALFLNCKLTSLDLSGFNTAKVTDMRYMFAGGLNQQTIYVGNDWSTAAVTESSDMFTNCYNLVGGQGTTYDANHIDKAYAHIDGGPSNPGYFTAKNAGLRGDVDGDGNVGVADVTALIDYLLTGNTTGVNLEAANVDGDSTVGVADVTALIDYILTGNW